jgi:endonuclease/exonuclease/phosphatase family metal-dependent hydrolase
MLGFGFESLTEPPENPMRVTRSLLAAMLLAAACSDESTDGVATPFGPEAEPSPDASHAHHSDISVMTRNMYVGADVDAVIGALITPDPSDDASALLVAISTLEQTQFPGRATAIAGEIAQARPHVVGLQEVSTVDISLPQLGVEVHLDFLPVLLAELAARGLQYEVAARVRNIEAAPFPGVSLIDEDAIVVDRQRVLVHETNAQRFTANLGTVAPGVVLARGWVSAALTIGERAYTVASAHLESGEAPGLDQLRAAQAAELAEALAGTAPVIVMGDLNDVPGSQMYQVLAGAGLVDLWAAMHPGTRGYTCCHAADLSNQVSQFDERIDYVFFRDGAASEKVTGRIGLVGETPSDRFRGLTHRLWPSDHAGIVARLNVYRPKP